MSEATNLRLVFYDHFNSASSHVLTKPIILQLPTTQTHRRAQKEARAVQMEMTQGKYNYFVAQVHMCTITRFDIDVLEIGHSSATVQRVCIYLYC